jgi:tetratricopeptide (TPR) repeat protein
VGRGVAELDGVSWLLARLGIGQDDSGETALRLLKQGAELEKEERYREAIQVYEQVLEFAPDEVTAYVALSSAYEALGERDQALARLEEAAQLAPDNADVLRRLGRLQCTSGDFSACIESLEKAVELEPDDSQGHYFLALAYQYGAQDGLDKAEAQYQEALRADPSLGRAHLALASLYRSVPGKEVLAVEEVKRALDLALEANDEELATRARSELARLYYARDQYDECIDEWKQVLESEPDDSAAHRRLGLCYAMRGEEGDLEQAVTELERALVLDYSHVDAYYFFLGRYYAEEKKDYPRAMFAWDQFLRLSDNKELRGRVREWVEAYQADLEEEKSP